jgi:sugar porter (SP) family MFS transporter
MLIAATFYVIGSVIALMGLSLEMVIVGKMVFGLGIGFAMHSAPVYISEISPPAVRGLLVSLKEAMIVVGMVVGNFTGFVFNGHEGFRYIFATGGVLAVVFGVGTFFLPDSARWLVLRDLKQKGEISDEAKTSLMKLRGAENIEEVEGEISEISNSVSGVKTSSYAALLNCKRQLIAGVGLVIFQQITGQPSVLYYTNTLLKGALGDSNRQVAGASCLVTTVKLFATMVSVMLVDRVGRKLLLLVGVAGMGLATMGLTIAFHVYGDDSSLVTILLLMVYVAFYQVGYGPITWLLISEIFPVSVRSRAVAVSVFTNFGTNVIMTFTFKLLDRGVGNVGTFGLFCSLCLCSWVFVWFWVPETRGKTLEGIDRVFYPNGR